MSAITPRPCDRCGEPVEPLDEWQESNILGDVERGHASCLTGKINRRDLHRLNAALRDGAWFLRCDALGCEETHPLDHEAVGQPCFGTGRWCGWLYLDLNRPDLIDRELRFCSVPCLQWWLERERINESRRPVTKLDRALRAPTDEIARRQAFDEIKEVRA